MTNHETAREEDKEITKEKLAVMKQMIKNERRANELMTNKISTLNSNMHMNNKTLNILRD